MTKREAGAIGGRVTVARHGREHMRAIGARGFAVTVERYWGGDRKACVRRFIELGLMAQDPVPGNGAWQFARKDGEPW
jgi:hypothetical protein